MLQSRRTIRAGDGTIRICGIKALCLWPGRCVKPTQSARQQRRAKWWPPVSARGGQAVLDPGALTLQAAHAPRDCTRRPARMAPASRAPSPCARRPPRRACPRDTAASRPRPE
ncbi:hypothetical protein EBN15_04800 [Xanthomonas cucurbitae]|nr:hypothetical protein EBN15_04800 [Xanthomonas cucurbitae]